MSFPQRLEEEKNRAKICDACWEQKGAPTSPGLDTLLSNTYTKIKCKKNGPVTASLRWAVCPVWQHWLQGQWTATIPSVWAGPLRVCMDCRGLQEWAVTVGPEREGVQKLAPISSQPVEESVTDWSRQSQARGRQCEVRIWEMGNYAANS